MILVVWNVVLIANIVCSLDTVYLVLVKLMKQKIEKEIRSDQGRYE